MDDARFCRTFKDTACEACDKADGTVVPCHCNMERGGIGFKARGIVAGLFFDCYNIADGRVPASKEERLKIWVRVGQKLMLDRFTAFMEMEDA